jgi:hypothetical protein
VTTEDLEVIKPIGRPPHPPTGLTVAAVIAVCRAAALDQPRRVSIRTQNSDTLFLSSPCLGNPSLIRARRLFRRGRFLVWRSIFCDAGQGCSAGRSALSGAGRGDQLASPTEPVPFSSNHIGLRSAPFALSADPRCTGCILGATRRHPFDCATAAQKSQKLLGGEGLLF